MGRGAATTRRALMWRDGLTFAVLTMIAVVLYAVTSLLFHSFQRHRDALGRQWTEKARTALAQGRPDEAVEDLRTAITFTPENRSNTVLLAEALAAAGKNEQAANYYLGLWEQAPGDGPINLQLARLTRKSHQVRFALRGGFAEQDDPAVAEKAIDYYRAAIYGTWPNDVLTHRYATRLELVNYLIGLDRKKEARDEVVLLAGASPDTADTDRVLAETFARLGDDENALKYYGKAASLDPRSVGPLRDYVNYAMAHGDYAAAAKALRTISSREANDEHDALALQKLSTQRSDVDRILLLTPDVEPDERRVEHIIRGAMIAKAALAQCLAHADEDDVEKLKQRQADWRLSSVDKSALTDNRSASDNAVRLTYGTMHDVVAACGAPTGRDERALWTLAQQGGGKQ